MAMRALLLGAVVTVWALALVYWGELPDSIPVHFGLNGEPDRFANKSVWSWFLWPAFGTVMTVGIGFVVPGWIRGMAERNSPLLNMPNQERFRALPTEARLAVVDACVVPLQVMALVLNAMFGWLVFSSAQVALGHWQTLPMWPTIGFVVAIIVCAAWLAITSSRAVAREQ